ncbi:MAG: Asp-tRNA(Asn)/Glu-tRNA(Gln) amidotransferase subunit GatC [Planctomycetota bacterium]|jgi:aspartyl/glutamyl-tRNA(Asn/Gln) amidotransferase C subunit
MDRDTVRDLCSLSKLNLDEDQMARAQEQITRLLGYFDMLQSVSTDEVAASPYPVAIPMRPRTDEVAASPYPVAIPMRPRIDDAEPALTQDAVLQNAPAQRAGSFLVPRVV